MSNPMHNNDELLSRLIIYVNCGQCENVNIRSYNKLKHINRQRHIATKQKTINTDTVVLKDRPIRKDIVD